MYDMLRKILNHKLPVYNRIECYTFSYLITRDNKGLKALL